jgi:glutamate-1-semialdehyde aminotransferase
VNSYQHKNEAVQKSINSVYRGKKNKKLTALINDKSIGYYAINVDGNKYFDLMYSLLKDSEKAIIRKKWNF